MLGLKTVKVHKNILIMWQFMNPLLGSDHQSFQNIGVATLGWNGLVDGYPCYHRE